MPGPRDIRNIRTDSLVDMGVPDAADEVLIRDATDGVVKIANVSDVGITDHGGLTGLADDDHTQYLNVARHDADDHSALTITESQITDLAHLTIEQVQDNLGTAFIVGGADLSTVYDDVANTLTLNVDNLDAAKITTGAFADARISQSSVTQHQTALVITESQISDLDHLTVEEVQDNLGTAFIVGGTDITVVYDDVANTLTFNKDALVAADIPVLDASKITTGTFANARISESSVTQHQAALTITESQISNLDHLTVEEVQDNLGTAFIVGGTDITVVYDDVANTLTFNKDALVAADIPSLDASKITTGTFVDARIAQSNVTQHEAALTLDASQTTTGIFADARIPSLDTSKITTGTFADARIAQSNVTQHQAALSITESQISDLGPYVLAAGGTFSGFVDISSTGSASLTDGTGILQVGPDGATNMGFDQNEIQVRTGAGAASPLFLNSGGGQVSVGGGGLSIGGALTFNTGNSSGTIMTVESDTGLDLLTLSVSADDFSLLNNQQSNGLVIYDGTGGVELWYNGAAVLEADSAGGVNIVSGSLKQGGTTVSLSNHTHAAGNATTLDGIDSTGFLRSNANDSYTGGTLTMAGTLLMSAHDINMNGRSIVNIAHIDGSSTNRQRIEAYSSNSGSNTDEQTANIMWGEGANQLTTTGGVATGHLGYTGDGYGYVGMGGRINSSNYQPYWDFFEMDYNSNNMRYLQQRGGTNNANRLPSITGWDTLRIRDNDGIFGYDGSSIRWKENVRDWTDWIGVLDLMPVIFDWADEYAPCYEHERVEPDGTVTGGPHVHDETCNREDIGLIAEEVNEIDPRLVKLDDEGKPRSVRYEMLTVYLIAAVKEMAAHLGITEDVKARGVPPGQGGAAGQGKRAPVPPAQRRGKGWRNEPVEPRPEPKPPAIWPDGVDPDDYPVGTHPQDVIDGWVPVLVDRTPGIPDEEKYVKKPDWTVEMGREGARAQGKHTRPPPE